MNYFFDSYALIEVFKENPAYRRFLDEIIITSPPDLAEVYYYFLRTGQPEGYARIITVMRPDLLQPTLKNWEEAAIMKFANKTRKLSFVDCLGYVMAREKRLKFLTGDQQFSEMPDVEFIK